MDPIGILLILVGGYALSRMSSGPAVVPVPVPDAPAQPVAAPAPSEPASGGMAPSAKEAGVPSIIATGKRSPGPATPGKAAVVAQPLPVGRSAKPDPGNRITRPQPRPTKTV